MSEKYVYLKLPESVVDGLRSLVDLYVVDDDSEKEHLYPAQYIIPDPLQGIREVYDRNRDLIELSKGNPRMAHKLEWNITRVFSELWDAIKKAVEGER